MAKFSTVIPLMHRECRLIPNVPLLLDESISVRSIKSEHIGPIITRRRALADILNAKTKCILIQSDEFSQPTIEKTALCGTFVLNMFSQTGASICEQAFVIRHVRSNSVVSVFDLPSSANTAIERFEIDSNTDPAAMKTLFCGVQDALQKDSSLTITLRRFNGALSKTATEDKVIDITICLESIFKSQSEIAFRFGLYNALLAGHDLENRQTLFKCLKRLYTERSNLVHGNKALDGKWVSENWELIVRSAKKSLLKKIEFLQDHTTDQWQQHLDSLALGAE